MIRFSFDRAMFEKGHNRISSDDVFSNYRPLIAFRHRERHRRVSHKGGDDPPLRRQSRVFDWPCTLLKNRALFRRIKVIPAIRVGAVRIRSRIGRLQNDPVRIELNRCDELHATSLELRIGSILRSRFCCSLVSPLTAVPSVASGGCGTAPGSPPVHAATSNARPHRAATSGRAVQRHHLPAP
jgi:hypothetical protein